MNELLDEIISGANIGNIVIDGDRFPIAFNTIIHNDGREVFNNIVDNDFPCLVIRDREKFLIKLEEYVNINLSSNRKFPVFIRDININKIKLATSYLFANATTEDFKEPIALLERNIEFLNDTTFTDFGVGITFDQLDCFDNSSILVTNTPQSILMETPNRMDIAITKEVEGELLKYFLPSISYGISFNSKGEKVCFIYTIMNNMVKQGGSVNQLRYSKGIKRELYKLNEGVIDNETEEYKDYLKGDSEYYPENISDVSPSSVMSLTLFLSLLANENINNIKGVTYLPVRFLARQIAADECDDTIGLETRNIKLQQNITDKFIRTFNRLQYHCSGVDIVSFPYENSEYLEINLLQENQSINNQILSNAYTSLITPLNNRRSSK